MNAPRTVEWLKMITQARNFARRKSYSDAVARLREVKLSIEAALQKNADEREKPNFAALLSKVSRELQQVQTQYDAWNAALAARRKATIENAAAEFKKPLPPPI